MKNLTWLDFKLTMVVWSKSQMRQSKVRRRGGEATHPPTNSIFLLPLFAGVHKIIPWSKKIVEGGPKKGPLGSKKLSKSVKILGWGREEANPPSPVVLLNGPVPSFTTSFCMFQIFLKFCEFYSQNWQKCAVGKSLSPFNQRNQIKHKSDIPNTLKYFFVVKSTWNPSHMYDLHKYYHQI